MVTNTNLKTIYKGDMANQGEKMPPITGGDGRLYYNFALGLMVELREDFEVEKYTLKIVGCHYINATEYYDVERDGVPLPQPLSANRLRYLFSRYGIKTLATGEGRRELPLTLDEVKRYYEYRAQQYANARARAAGVPEYVALEVAAQALSSKIGFAQAFGREDEAAALQKQQTELKRRAAAALTAHGIVQELLNEPPRCELCNGKGYEFNCICSCAVSRTAEIKEFNAKERRRLASLTAGNNGG